MRSKRFFHPRRATPLLFLVLAVLGFIVLLPSIPLAHASAPTYVKTITGTQTSITFTGLTKGDFLGVDVFASSVNSANGFTIFDSQANSYTQLYNFEHGLSAAWWTIVKATGTDTITIGCVPGGCSVSGGTADADQYTGVSSVIGSTVQGNCGSSCPNNVGTDVLQSAIVAGTGTTIWEPIMVSENSGPGGTLTLAPTSTSSDGVIPAPQSQNQCQGSTGITVCTFTSFPTVSFPIFRVHYSDSLSSFITDSHADVILAGSIAASGSSTGCFGNCGNPAVTLINANATHTINFNFTITLFYAFQSSVNGFVINQTTNIAKPYPGGILVGLAIYTATCPVTVQPFSQQCPGTLATSQTRIVSGKGPDSTTSGVPIVPGEWIAIAVSSQFSGLDLNETNTICTNQCFDSGHLQYSNGFLPSTLSGVGRCAATGTLCNTAGIDNTGLWAFVSGTIVITNPIPPPSVSCGPGLDFMLACAVNSLCSVVTSQCQTGSSIFLIVILTIVSIAFLLGIFSFWLPGMNITTKGMGEFAVLIFIGWFVAFAAYGLLLPYLIILMFFVVAWLFLGKSRGTGPI